MPATSLNLRSLFLGLAALLLLDAPATAQLGDSKPWTRWQRSGQGAEVDHARWDRFLASYRRVGRDGIARIAYGRVTPRDRAELVAYIAALGKADVDAMSRPQQLAYWINLYNAETVRLVLEAYPVKSIKAVRGGFLNSGPWREKVVTVRGVALSLDDIEHRILRPIWRDPRIHYAVNCAALGCPDLAARAFTAERANAMLDQGARAYINHPRGFRLEGRTLVASSIFDWYAGDFGGPDGVLTHARRYATPATLAKLAGKRRADRYEYEWALNDAR